MSRCLHHAVGAEVGVSGAHDSRHFPCVVEITGKVYCPQFGSARKRIYGFSNYVPNIQA